MESWDHTPPHMTARVGLRGPRAPPPARRTPRMSTSVTDMSHSRLSDSRGEPDASGSNDTSDSDIDTNNLVLPRNFREIRALAAEQRRVRAEEQMRVVSQERVPTPPVASVSHNVEDDDRDVSTVTDELDLMETSSDPGSISTSQTQRVQIASPRAQPPLRAPMALPAFLGERMSALYTPRRSATDSPNTRHEPVVDEEPEVSRRDIPSVHEPRASTARESLSQQDVQLPPQSQASSQPEHVQPSVFPLPTTATAETSAAQPAASTSPMTQRRRRRESQRRISSLRGDRREPNNLLLAALSTQANTGPGVLLPSLYGYFSNEPAPTQLRPAGVSYGQHAQGRVGAPWHDDTSLGATSSDGHGYVHPRLSERILASGPSVTNLHLSESSAHKSPGAELRVQTAQLRNAHVCPGAMLFPPGITSSLCKAEKAKDAHMSRKFEENSALSFSWMIEDASLLAEEVKLGDEAPGGGHQSEAWKLQPLFGEERWRLELVRRAKTPTVGLTTPTKSRSDMPDSPHVLCLYLSYLGLMAMPFAAELAAHIMIGIRPAQRFYKPSRTLDSACLWRTFFSFTFQQDNDTVVFDRFPDLADIVAAPEVAECNSFDLVIQIATGPSVLPTCDVRDGSGHRSMRLPFEALESAYVPRSLLHGLTALVDDGSTGDLMVTVLEKGYEQQPTEELAESVGLKSFIHAWPTGTPLPEPDSDAGTYPSVFVRDRVLWAHSSILRERSEFFATMVDSQFSEGALHETSAFGSRGRTRDAWRRPYRMLRIPGADFVTMYWFLRFLYTEEVELLKEEDVQGLALDDHWILNQPNASARPDFKWRSVDGLGDWDTDFFPPMDEAGPPTLSEGYAVRGATPTSSDKAPNLSDPHPHPPMLPVPPASALALYRLAHRYGVQSLCDLTMTHIMSSLTPHNAVHYLLCTALLTQIQQEIQEYIIENWHAVSSDPEFEYCCDQVSAGEWGPLAGRALLSLMRQLRRTNPPTQA